MSPILTGVIASGISGNLSTTSYESIATVTVGTAVSSITFSSIPSTYKHLQIRGVALTSGATNPSYQFNGDTTAGNYISKHLWGNGSVANANNQTNISMFDYNPSTSYPSAFIMDIVDYASTVKNKSTRIFAGSNTNGGTDEVALWSGLYFPSTITGITSITLLGNGSNWSTNSTFALYGIKG